MATTTPPGGIASTTKKMSGEIYVRMMKVELGKTLSREDALRLWNRAERI